MAGKYKLTDQDKKFILGDKRIKSVRQRKDSVIEIETNNITMYSHGKDVRAYNDDSDRSNLPQTNLGKVKVEIDVDGYSNTYESPPFRVTNPKPKRDHYDRIVHHPMYAYHTKMIRTYGCLGHFYEEFQRAFINKDLVQIVTTILASMEHVYNHESYLWEWEVPNG